MKMVPDAPENTLPVCIELETSTVYGLELLYFGLVQLPHVLRPRSIPERGAGSSVCPCPFDPKVATVTLEKALSSGSTEQSNTNMTDQPVVARWGGRVQEHPSKSEGRT